MGYVLPDSVVCPRSKFQWRLFALIVAVCTISPLLLILAANHNNMFDRLINGPLSEPETYLKEKILQSMENRWETFRLRYNKVYKDKVAELDAKLEFFKNQIYVNEHNLRYAKNEVTYEIEINQFSDIKPKNVANILTKIPTFKDRKYSGGEKMVSGLPETVDWRLEGAVSHVKDQGPYDFGWAFSVTGSLESQQFLKNKHLTSLSEQDVIDCMFTIMMKYPITYDKYLRVSFWLIDYIGGINTEAAYPYTGVPVLCKYHEDNLNITDYGVIDIASGDEDRLQEVVATIGPVSTYIDASLQSFRFYKRGVYSDPKCGEDISHAALIVGYGTDPVGGDYWLVKNSWGKSWGDEGYIKVARNKKNMCGVATLSMCPVV